jgi:hypothetical protein
MAFSKYMLNLVKYVPRLLKHQEESVPLREVDYDVNPTELYKLIEAKDWTQAIQRCNEVA